MNTAKQLKTVPHLVEAKVVAQKPMRGARLWAFIKKALFAKEDSFETWARIELRKNAQERYPIWRI